MCSDAAYVGRVYLFWVMANEVLTLIADYNLCLCTVVEARYDTSWQSQEYRHLQNSQTDIIQQNSTETTLHSLKCFA